jgi:hypothetical protein
MSDNWVSCRQPTPRCAARVEFKPVLDPEIVLFAEVAGRTIGCAVAVPGFNQVLKRMHGRLFHSACCISEAQ